MDKPQQHPGAIARRAPLKALVSTLMVVALGLASCAAPSAKATEPADVSATSTVGMQEAVSENPVIARQANDTEKSACQSDGKIRPEEIKGIYVQPRDDNVQPRPWVTMKLGFTLHLDGKHCNGDTITIKTPKQIGTTDDIKEVQIGPKNGKIFATAIYDGKGDITITLNETVEDENLFEFKGDAYWWRSLTDRDITLGANNLVWELSSDVTRTVTINVTPCTGCNISPLPQKWGRALNNDTLSVVLETPIGTVDNQKFYFEDLLGSANQTMNCESNAITATAYSQINEWGSATNRKSIPVHDVTCESSKLSGYVTVDKGWKGQVNIQIKVDPKDPGPWKDKVTFTSEGEPKAVSATVRRQGSGGSGSYQSRVRIPSQKPSFSGEFACSSPNQGETQAKIVIPAVEHVKYLVNDQEVAAGEHPLTTAGEVVVKMVPANPATHVIDGETLWRFNVKACKTAITPKAPTQHGTVNCVNCATANPAQAEVEIPATPGVEYKLNGTTVAAGKHPLPTGESTVQAAVTDPATSYLEGIHTWTFTAKDCACMTDVVLPMVSMTPGTCTTGSTIPTDPTVAIPAVNGIDFSEPAFTNAGKRVHVRVVATLRDGFRFATPLSDNWEMNNDGTATFSSYVDMPVCPIPIPTPTQEPTPPTTAPTSTSKPTSTVTTAPSSTSTQAPTPTPEPGSSSSWWWVIVAIAVPVLAILASLPFIQQFLPRPQQAPAPHQPPAREAAKPPVKGTPKAPIKGIVK